METTTLELQQSVNRSPVRPTLLLIALAIACFAISPQVRAACQQGCSDIASANTFLGEDALLNNTTGVNSTAVGSEALRLNTDGFANTAIGVNTLNSNTTGYHNVAAGLDALYFNTIGYWNTAIGNFALYGNTVGGYNTATGSGALENNTQGGGNTATGWGALGTNTIGTGNTAIGYEALYDNGRGSFNIALGDQAGMDITGSNNIAIGSLGKRRESNTIRIGTVGTHTDTFIAGISGVTVAGGVGIIVDTNGHLGTVVSSARFKEAVEPMDEASESIFALKPVTFRYKHDLDPDGIPQFGLVAEEVEKVSPDLVARDEHGKPYTVRYEAVNVMLLNEFLKEHRTVQELKSAAVKQETTIARLENQLDALTAGLQKVSAQLEVSKAAPQTVQNSR